jgi:hypothetical protein
MGVKLDLTLRDVFENRVLSTTFGPRRDGMTRGWRKVDNEQLHNGYFHQA